MNYTVRPCSIQTYRTVLQLCSHCVVTDCSVSGSWRPQSDTPQHSQGTVLYVWIEMWWSTDAWWVVCRLLKPASQVQLLPVTLWTTTKLFPDCWSVRSQTVEGDHQTKQCLLRMKHCWLLWYKYAYSAWLTTKDYNKQLVKHNFWKQPTAEDHDKKLCTLRQLFLCCSYGYQWPMVSPNILQVTPAFSLHLWLINLCFLLNNKILWQCVTV
jgi:hypothetical protein